MFFETTERLVAEDTDERNDVYERVGATTRLVSAPGDVATGVAHDAYWRYWLRPVSRNGETVVFETPTSNSPRANDNPGPDLYARASGITRLLTAKPATVAPPPPPDTSVLPEQPQPLLQTPPVGSPQAPPITQTPTPPVTGPTLAAVRAALVADSRSAAAALRRVGRARLRRSGSFTITGVDALLAGTLTVRLSTRTRSGTRGRTVASARRTFPGAGRATVRVKLARSGRRLLHGRRRALTLTLRYDDALGRSAQHSAAITLRR